MFNVFIYVN